LKTAYQAFTLSVGETVNPLNWPVVIPAALGFAGAMALGMLWTLRDRSRMGAFLATQVVVIYVFGIAFGAAAAKHLAVILPAWLGIVAAGIVRARSRWLAVGLGCLVFATMAVSDLNYFTGRQFADADMVTPWREIAARVASQATPGDAILVGYRMDAGVRDAFARYYEGPGEPTWLGRDEWQPVLASALREHETVFLLLHDGDPWRDIEAWFETLPPGLLFARETFQDEEHTLDRLRAGEVFGDATKFRSPLYRLYRITKTGERSH